MLRLLATLSPGALLIIGGVVVALPLSGAAYYGGKFVGHRAGYSQGSADVAAQVTKQNVAAAEIARKAKGSVDDCYAANGNWSQENGTCDR